ncbi:DarT ssDNA thymidine ADP-ribosyltransferase family protein [Candidatus Viridilinea mediisalina]|uniref:Appr-1-p processing protein n=1 Tax=Candidatus Viridilinea mediisalina TaxID=2024553 RepID=A0A2A6RP82_9CHLR|nr:DarT ssDNA thymidine ADP-ribosyltransferase family protein [Candidatus Viridilinea mediisalina]PDW04904.1 Appr-1-p processing protein [Candidatus Viridilinea mediisalina]
MKKPQIRGLYYITHINNLPSILEHGILSHAAVVAQRHASTPIYDSQIVTNRQQRKTPDGRSLWEFANVYFQARNPMLYRVIQGQKQSIAVLHLRPDLLREPNIFVTTGNAASQPTAILPVEAGLEQLRQMWNIVTSEWWKEEDGSKRKIMAECLVPDRIPPHFIDTIYVAHHAAAQQVKALIAPAKLAVVPEPHMFFQPRQIHKITEKLNLFEGDMFFSQMQTLTISVNTVGIMGKGLASRTKYQFPDVYVYYEDLCRKKILTMGQPAIYKREGHLDQQLADEPTGLSELNSNKWFLLFPTKRHWREGSDLAGIEQGLQWVVAAYEREGIRSLALPALGCGLGGLPWQDVGPLMCRYLAQLPIQVSIYLPREQVIPAHAKQAEFLLGSL